MSSLKNPSIYVACLASYNDGRLHGVRIDATLGVDHIWNEVNAMLKKSPVPNAEEWAIHSDANFYDINISESMDFESVVEISEFLKEHGELGAELINNYGGNIDNELFAKLPSYIRDYFDYESFANDLFINDYLDIEVDRKFHLFSYH